MVSFTANLNNIFIFNPVRNSYTLKERGNCTLQLNTENKGEEVIRALAQVLQLPATHVNINIGSEMLNLETAQAQDEKFAQGKDKTIGNFLYLYPMPSVVIKPSVSSIKSAMSALRVASDS